MNKRSANHTARKNSSCK